MIEVPLREHLEHAREGQDRFILLGFGTVVLTMFLLDRTRSLLRQADQEAIHVLADTFKNRMDTTNEWRGALEDQAKGKATIASVETLKGQLDEVKAEQRAVADRSMGAGKLAVIIAGIIGGGGTLIGIAFAIARSQGVG